MPEEFSSSTDARIDVNAEITKKQMDSLRVRCPDCRRLYLVQFADIQEAKPRFECVQCHSRFWISLPDIEFGHEIIGLPLQVKEAPIRSPSSSFKVKATEPCPKCAKPIEVGRAECSNCGVVIEKMKAMAGSSEGIPAHSATLGALWKRLLGDYGDETLHSEFLRACQRERNLAYAAALYHQMQTLMPTDEITLRRLKEIQALASTLLPPSVRQTRVPRRLPNVWSWPLIGLTIMIIVGMVSPLFRNLVGACVLFAFAAFALRVQFRKR